MEDTESSSNGSEVISSAVVNLRYGLIIDESRTLSIISGLIKSLACVNRVATEFDGHTERSESRGGGCIRNHVSINREYLISINQHTSLETGVIISNTRVRVGSIVRGLLNVRDIVPDLNSSGTVTENVFRTLALERVDCGLASRVLGVIDCGHLSIERTCEGDTHLGLTSLPVIDTAVCRDRNSEWGRVSCGNSLCSSSLLIRETIVTVKPADGYTDITPVNNCDIEFHLVVS